MARSSFQKAVLRRQIIYLALIIVLFTVSMLWRGQLLKLPSFVADQARAKELNQARRTYTVDQVRPADNFVHRIGDWVASRTIAAQASPDALDLATSEQGGADVSGSAVRLLLTGSRGWATTILWYKAMDFQKRNEFHKLEEIVDFVTMLQPHFITPWLYQSWNMTYNVSVENDRLTDTFYYIARGIELLAKGERLNRDSPDMRYNLAFYTQNKFSVSDKKITLRSLFQLACLKPSERIGFRDKETQQIDEERFRTFVRKNPILCRRLRDQLNYTRPLQIVQFLEDNERVPTRYDRDKQDKLLPIESQFPALPPQFLEGPDEPNNQQAETDDSFDPFMAARAWFSYSLVIVPPPKSDPTEPLLTDFKDRFKYRMPKAPTIIIYRQGAPRAQTYLAEFLQKDGWFDAKTRWYPDAGTPDVFWFGDSQGGLGEAIATTGANSQDAWAKAYDMWSRHGTRNGLLVPTEEMARRQDLASGVPQDENVSTRMSDEQLASLGLTRERVRARDFLTATNRNLLNTNFIHWFRTTEAEQKPEVVAARQRLFEAEARRQSGSRDPAAIRDYALALAAWRDVLQQNKAFHRSDSVEEATYETQLNLMFMLENSPQIRTRLKADLTALQALVPAAHDGTENDPMYVEFGRLLAEREANLRMAMYDSKVQDRVDNLFTQTSPDAELIKDWPTVLKWKRALAVQADQRAAGAKDPRSAAADEPAWREKALKALLDARRNPLSATGWPDILAARDEVAREVVLREFAWLPEYAESVMQESTLWVRPELVKTVRQRLKLSIPKITPQITTEPTPQIR